MVNNVCVPMMTVGTVKLFYHALFSFKVIIFFSNHHFFSDQILIYHKSSLISTHGIVLSKLEAK